MQSQLPGKTAFETFSENAPRVFNKIMLINLETLLQRYGKKTLFSSKLLNFIKVSYSITSAQNYVKATISIGLKKPQR